MYEKSAKSVCFYRNGVLIFKIESVNNFKKEKLNSTVLRNENNLELIFEEIEKDGDIIFNNNSEINQFYLLNQTDYWIWFKELENDYLSNIIDKVLFKQRNNEGIINSRNYVGTLNCCMFDFDYELEFRNYRSNHKEDFEKLVESISNICFDLLTRSSSFYGIKIKKTEEYVQEDVNYTQLCYIQHFLHDDRLMLWVNYLIHNSDYRINKSRTEKIISEVEDIDVDELIASFSSENFPNVSMEGSKKSKNRYPLYIKTHELNISVDTDENRFVKYVLEFLSRIISDVRNIIDENQVKLQYELNRMESILDKILYNPFWLKIGSMNEIPWNSKILQKKYPYDQIFQFYNDLQLSGVVSMPNISNDYLVGIKDAAILYQYWVFVVLFFNLSENFGVNSSLSNWLSVTPSSLNFTLKEGNTAYAIFNLKENRVLKLYYNKTYTSITSNEIGNSFSHDFKPDISIELYENESLLGLLHFDAKYKDESISKTLKEDIDKMHAYKDGILGTLGAYCISPITSNQIYSINHEGNIFPSVGSLSLNLNADQDSDLDKILKIIESFIKLEVEDFNLLFYRIYSNRTKEE